MLSEFDIWFWFLSVRALGVSGDGSENWVLATHGKDLDSFPEFWLCSGPTLVFFEGVVKAELKIASVFSPLHSWNQASAREGMDRESEFFCCVQPDHHSGQEQKENPHPS